MGQTQKDLHPFVGRKEAIEQFNQILESPQGKVILVVGQVNMGKTFLLHKMVQIAQEHSDLGCTPLQYKVTPTDSIDSTMLEIISDAADAVQSLSGRFRGAVNANKEKLSSLFSAIGAIPVAGQKLEKIGTLILSLAEHTKRGNIRQQLKQMLTSLSEKLPDTKRVLFFIDPEKLMPENCADTWRILLHDLPKNILFIFAQRPEDQLINNSEFCKLEIVDKIPVCGLDVLTEKDIEELITFRKEELPANISESKFREILTYYGGHPYSVQAATDLLVEGVDVGQLPNRPEPVDFSNTQIDIISKVGTDAISLFEAYAVLDVLSSDEVVTEVAGINSKILRSLLVNLFLKSLLHQESNGMRIYNNILSDEILKRVNESDKQEYHHRAVAVYQRLLKDADKSQTPPYETALLKLPEHVLVAQGKQSFVDCLISCHSMLSSIMIAEKYISYNERAIEFSEENPNNKTILFSYQGRLYRSLSKPNKAIEMFKSAIEIAEKNDNEGLVILNYYSLGCIYKDQNDEKNAIQIFNATIEKIAKAPKQIEYIHKKLTFILIDIFKKLGEVYENRHEVDMSIKAYQFSLKIAEKAGDKKHVALMYNALGIVYKNANRLEKSIEMYKKGLNVSHLLQDFELYTYFYNNLGNLYHAKKDFNNAKLMYIECIKILEDLLHKQKKDWSYFEREQDLARKYIVLGDIYRDCGDLIDAENMYNKSLKITEKRGTSGSATIFIGPMQVTNRISGDLPEGGKVILKLGNPTQDYRVLAAIAFKDLANIYHQQEVLDKAEEMYCKSLGIVEDIDEALVVSNCACLGRLYSKQNDFEKSVEMYNRALELAEKKDMLNVCVNLYGDLGYVYQKLDNLSASIQTFEKCLNVSTKIDDKAYISFAYRSLGYLCRSENKDKAVAYYFKSLDIEKGLGNHRNIAENYIYLGDVYKTHDDLDKAIDMYKESLQVCVQNDFYKDMARLYNNIGRIYQKQNKYDNSIEMYEKALEINEKLNRVNGLIINYSNLGDVYKACSKFLKSAEMYEQALCISNNQAMLEKSAGLCLTLHFIYRDIGEFDKSIQMCNKNCAINQQLDKPDSLIEHNLLLGDLHLRNDKLVEAKSYFLKALDLSKESTNIKVLPVSYMNLGNLFLNSKKFRKSIFMYKKALKISKTEDMNELSANLYSNIGKAYGAKKRFRKAEKMILKAIGSYKQLESLENAVNQYHILLNIYQNQGRLNEAIEVSKVLIINSDLQLPKSLADMYYALGLVYRDKKDIEKAIEMHENSLQINKKIEDLPGIVKNYFAQGCLYQCCGQFDMAIELYLNGLQISKAQNMLELSAFLCQNLGVIYKKLGQKQKGLEYKKRSLEFYAQLGLSYIIKRFLLSVSPKTGQ